MAVEVKYVVIREGEEKMSFTSKTEPLHLLQANKG